MSLIESMASCATGQIGMSITEVRMSKQIHSIARYAYKITFIQTLLILKINAMLALVQDSKCT